MHYCFVINGRQDKSGLKDNIEGQIAALAQKPDYSIHQTTGPKDATTYVAKCCEEQPDAEICFVACGGDGTINEVASGLMAASSAEGKSMAVLAYGSGNDFVKYYKGRDFKNVAALLAGTQDKIDIMRIGDRWSINVCNFGFDAVVGDTGAKLAAKGWKNPYRWGIVKAIFSGRFNNIKVTADGELLNQKKMLLCTVANNHYVGGEFFCAPRAKNNDGLLDVCLVNTMLLMQFLRLLPIYTAGNHLDDPRISSKLVWRQVKKVEIEAPKTIGLCLDGEMIYGNKFLVEIVPAAVSFIIPAE